MQNIPAKHQSVYSGEYTIAANQILNGGIYYISSNKAHAIWYVREHNSWAIGALADLGTDFRGVTSKVGEGPACPSEVSKNEWYYYNDGWKKGGNDIKIECIGNNGEFCGFCSLDLNLNIHVFFYEKVFK